VTVERAVMARIGLAIREVYRRPGLDALPAHLEDHYGIRVAATARLNAGVIRVDRHDGPPWVARLFLSGRPLDRTEEDAEILRFLERQGFPAERCAHPEPVTMLDGRAVLVTDFVAGKRPAGNPTTRRKLGDLLGRMHTMATEAGPAERPAGSLHHLPDYEGSPERDLAAAAALIADLHGRVPDQWRQLYELISELLPEGDDGHGLPEAFVHPDPVRDNVIVTPGGPVLVDWAGAGRGPRLACLASLLHSAGPEHAGDVLAGYRRHTDLTAEELDRLEGVLWIRPLWLAAWQCWLVCVSAKVNQAFTPDRDYIVALAGRVRASR
jgi:Ser/Thr protein kinase RdoA (MazF antagonist)